MACDAGKATVRIHRRLETSIGLLRACNTPIDAKRAGSPARVAVIGISAIRADTYVCYRRAQIRTRRRLPICTPRGCARLHRHPDRRLNARNSLNDDEHSRLCTHRSRDCAMATATLRIALPSQQKERRRGRRSANSANTCVEVIMSPANALLTRSRAMRCLSESPGS